MDSGMCESRTGEWVWVGVGALNRILVQVSYSVLTLTFWTRASRMVRNHCLLGTNDCEVTSARPDDKHLRERVHVYGERVLACIQTFIIVRCNLLSMQGCVAACSMAILVRKTLAKHCLRNMFV